MKINISNGIISTTTIPTEEIKSAPELYYLTYKHILRSNFFLHPKLAQIAKASNEGAQSIAWSGGCRSLKTTSFLSLCGWHLTGIYPNGENVNEFGKGYVYDGYRFKRPVNAIIVGLSNYLIEDQIQQYMFRGYKFRPADILFATKIINGQRATMVRKMYIPHFDNDGKYDGDSVLFFKSCIEGEARFQSYSEIDFIYIDEEPPFPIFQECQMRLAAMKSYGQHDDRKTFMYMGYCPKAGRTEVTNFFFSNAPKDIIKNTRLYVQAGWGSNPFLSDEEKERLAMAASPFTLPALRDGEPAYGAGKVFEIDFNRIIVDPFDPDDNQLLICGIDPSSTSKGTWGACLLSRDVISDTITVVREYLKSGLTLAEHADNMANRPLPIAPYGVPCICDPAGGGEDDKTRLSAMNYLRNIAGFNTIAARKTKNTKEAAIDNIYLLVRSGRLKIARTCTNLIEEMNIYARDEKGKIIKENDHLIDALLYAIRGIKDAVSMNMIRVNKITQNVDQSSMFGSQINGGNNDWW